MENLRAAVARAIEGAAQTRPGQWMRDVLSRKPVSVDEQHGQGLAEYALILGLIAIVAIISLIFLGTSVSGLFEDIINKGFDYVTDIIGP